MSIEIDTSRLAAQTLQTTDGAIAQPGVKSALGALLSGKSVTVSEKMPSDLEALVARLKNENERARFALMLTSLASIGQSLSDAQKRTLEEGLALSEKLEEQEKLLEGQVEEESASKADMLLLQAKIDALAKQIEQAVQDGKDHNELVAEQKRLRAELAEKEQAVADTKGKIEQTKNEVAAVKGRISAVIKSIGENAIKTIANELSSLVDPERADRPAETEKAEKKEAEANPFAAIRESLAEIERDLAETVTANRVETV